ncbi:CheR family methyltransferase [Erythrobacter sp. BLCC-B19]|uniref:CheR family methyltransferase n=1 Tax=Erythrobacter sp. BLCC-B19 TaxID=3025315 RepID=UPI0023611C34|nr:protein-glutamate O-methyltransferase CheR [Erythrobacter sp. BLCC-B19]WDA42885.1 protein-glutamate O-methyltransferase CheR [Erythrobacter sp. BLCC-B19]
MHDHAPGTIADDNMVPGVSPAIYSEADFRRIADLIHAASGIVLSDRKKMLAYSRLAPLVRRSGLTSFGAFLDTLASDPAGLDEVITALTTNHTYFHREPHHFDHFGDVLRGDLVARALAGEPVRIWSAGCSSGEEIWTLMMVLLGSDRTAGLTIARSNVLALASDISATALAGARAATYPARALDALPEALRRNWCVPIDSKGEPCLAIDPEVQALVRFRTLNLMGDWPMRRPFEVIFCRNVMIYFDTPTKERLLERFTRQLMPGGYLYIGHSERVSGPAAALLEPVGPTIYRRKGAA